MSITEKLFGAAKIAGSVALYGTKKAGSGAASTIRGINAVGEGTARVLKPLQPAADKALDIALAGASRTGKAIGKSSFKPSANGRTIGNFMTGYQMKTGAQWAWGAGIAAVGLTAGPMLGYQATKNWKVSKTARQNRMGSVVYSGGLPSQLYDAAPNINQMTGKYDLGATGDITLALSANRSTLAKSRNSIL